jgi:hypothetical protein
MVWLRVSPANAHYEMLASLDSLSSERFCRQQNLAQLLALLWLVRLDVDLVCWLDLKRAAFMVVPCSATARRAAER